MLVLAILCGSCETEFQEIDLEQSKPTVASDEISFEIDAEHKLFVFPNRLSLDATIGNLQQLPLSSFFTWERQQGITTVFGEFNRVILAEDELEEKLLKLPQAELEKIVSGPELHSEKYNEALERGLIKKMSPAEGGYFEYSISDPYVAPVLNTQGLVKIEGILFKYTPNAVKMIFDGDFDKLSLVDAIDYAYEDDQIAVIPISSKQNDSKLEPKALDYNWTTFPNELQNDPGRWFASRDRRQRYRWRAWVDGKSNSATALVDDLCTRVLSCTFVIRTQAQKKNIWGNYQYTSDFSPRFEYDNAWTYSYNRYNDNLCGLYSTTFYSVPTYSCSGSSTFNCPVSPSSGIYPTTNNGFLNQTPHGEWTANPPYYPNGLGYFSTAFIVRGGFLEYSYTHPEIDNGSMVSFQY